MSGMFRFLTAGESHGEALVAVIDGVPAGLSLAESQINEDLARRQRGYGRGGRMKIERDQVRILSGVRWGSTLGSPITLQIADRDVTWDELARRAEASEVRCADPAAAAAMIAAIDAAKEKGDTLGGVFEVVALGCPVGLGSYVQWDRRLDGRLAQAFSAIQAIKGVELGLGFETARRPGSAVHDEILFDAESGFKRKTNNAGGLEGGVTNGQPVVVRAAMKPLSTLRTPLKSVDLATKEAVDAVVERSDVCAVPAAGIVGEAMMAIVLSDAFLEKFGGDSIQEIRRNYDAYLDSLKSW